MKKNKIISTILATVFSASLCLTVAGCGGSGAGGSEAVDSHKTQLYVKNYQGGFGNKWLYQGKEKFEKLYEGVSLEEGKSGVQVMITDKKETPKAANIENDIYEVYFVEKVQYLYMAKQNVMEDLTDIVTAENIYEPGKSIESKLSDEQKAYFGIEESDGKTHYYALPHYFAAQGIIYDKDLFDEQRFYFIDGYESKSDIFEKFVQSDADVKSAGPDGEKGTSDDGLPATYEDFWTLCDYIVELGFTALNWGAKTSEYYISQLLSQLVSDYQGKSQNMLNATFDGTMNDLIKIENGNIVKENGEPVTESVTLDPAIRNGYETYRSAGLYYALNFVKKLISADSIKKYTVATNINSQSYTAFDAQDDYLLSRHDSTMKRQAMLIDGNWWDSETTSAFDDYSIVYGDAAKKENCNYRWMPLPKATKEKIGTNGTMTNTLESLCFVKKGLNDVKKKLALEFVQIMNTDEAFEEFTVATNTLKDFNYTIGNETYNKLSPFGKDFYNKYQQYEHIQLQNNNEQFYTTTYNIQMSSRYAISTSDIFPSKVFAANPNKTVDKYFTELYSYAKNTIWA